MILSIYLNKKKKKTITMVFTHDPISDVKTNKNLKPLLSIFPSFKFSRTNLSPQKEKVFKNKEEAHPVVQHPTTHAAICHHKLQNLLPLPSSYI